MYGKREIEKIVNNQHEYFKSAATFDYRFRKEQLQKLKDAIIKNQDEIAAALKKDLKKSDFDIWASETGFILRDIRHTLKNLKKWMRPVRTATPIVLQAASSRYEYIPLGVNLIISPFNYPFQLCFSPLAAAIAAGNTAVIKTSELSPASSSVIEKIIRETFSPEYIAYIPGEVKETQILLEQKFDHIFFTGSSRVGSIVMKAAANNLTPVTLEMGGKNPCIVHKDADPEIAARRIVYGKFMNAGQTCVSPDYLIVHKDIKKELLERINNRIRTSFSSNPAESEDYGRIINKNHFNRIVNLIKSSGTLLFNYGEPDVSDLYIPPVVLDNVSVDSPVMKEEIFGPILPVLTYNSIEEIITITEKMPQSPLALYIFSSGRKFQKEILNRIPSGGVSINHTIQHLVNFDLPFGGKGLSGMGNYHGYHGFKTFSHARSIYKAAAWFDFPLIYPPYKKKTKWLKKLF